VPGSGEGKVKDEGATLVRDDFGVDGVVVGLNDVFDDGKSQF